MAEPFLTDRHVHLFLRGAPAIPSGIKTIINAFLEHNIKEVYDMGSRDALGFRFRGIFEKSGITLRTCGYALFKEGGYGGFLGRPVKDKTDIRKYIEDLYQKGADFIKVINSGILKEDGGITGGGFPLEELKLIVSMAHYRGLRVFCHVSSEEKIRDALEAGVDSIEHGFFMPEECLFMMKEQAVSWTPTVYALWALIQRTSKDKRARLERILSGHLQMVGLALEIDVTVNIGSDSGSTLVEHGEGFIKEKQMLYSIRHD
ncbi:MAG: hypothetical protein D6778_03135 [Nitrospirae bacterium]|nr:MAG: hypothetical protein D6778_03135 [Nitrospirota bacterium]